MSDNNDTAMKKGKIKVAKKEKKGKQKKDVESTQQENGTRRRELFGDLDTFKKQADKNGNARDSLISVFDELINGTDFRDSLIDKFNTLDAGTRNMIYNNQELMQKVLDDMFKVNEGKQLTEEQSIQVNKFLKNLQSDLENNEYSLINHPENDDAINWLITQLDNDGVKNKIYKSEKGNFETNINTVRRLMDFQKIRRELLRNNLYYKKPENITEQQQEEQKPENTTEQQQEEQKPQTPTLDSFIDSAESEEDIEQVGKLIKDVKFENFGDLTSITIKYSKKREKIIKEGNIKKDDIVIDGNIKKDDIVIDYINNLDEEELKYFINNTLLNEDARLEIIEFISLQQKGTINEKVEQNIVSFLMTNPDVYDVLKDNDNATKLIQKYQDAQLIDRDERTVLEESALSGNDESIKKLENKIQNGEELTESMKNMLLLYSNKNNKYTKDNRKTFKKKLDEETKEINKNIKDNNKKIKKIDSNIKDKSKIIQKNEEKLKKKQEELYTKYNKNTASFFGKRNFEKKRNNLRNEINTLQTQIENDRKYILDQEREKGQIKTNNTQLNNKIQQTRTYRDNKNNKELQELYELNYNIEDFKEKNKYTSFSDIISSLKHEDDKIQIAILNSYCKNTDKLTNDKDFKELLDYCIKVNDSLKVDDGVKKPLDVLVEKDSLKKLTNDRIYDLLHNEKLKDKTQDNILNNLPDNKLSALISKAVEQIEDNTEIEDSKEKQLMEAKKNRNKDIIDKLDIDTLQKDGKFETINTLIDYAKDCFSKEDQTKTKLLNNITNVLEIQEIPDEISNEEINKQKEINKQTIQTLRNIYDIYRDNEQIVEQDKIIKKFVDGIDNLIDSPESIYDLIDFADSFYDEKDGQTEEEEKEVELLKDKEFEEFIEEILETKIDTVDSYTKEDNSVDKKKLNEQIIEEINKQIKNFTNNNNDIDKHNKEIDEHNKKIDENIAKINEKITTINEIIKLKKELEAIKNDGSEGERAKNLKIQQKQRQINEKCKTIEEINNNSSIDDLTKQIETLNSEIEKEEKKRRNDYQNTKNNQDKIEKLTKIRNAINRGDIDELKSLQMEQAQILDDIDKNKTKTERRKRKNAINKEIINKTVIPDVTDKTTPEELQDVQNKIKLLVKISKNNKDLVGDIQNKIKEPINKLIENEKIDTVLKIASESGNLITCLDNKTINEIYDKIKDKTFGHDGVKHKHLADTLIQIYNSYEKTEDKKEQKEEILNKLLSLTPESLVSCIQNNEICDDLLLKLIEGKPNLLNNIEVDSKNEKIIEQVNKILENDKIKLEDNIKTKLQEFAKQYTDEEQIVKQQQAQQQNNQQQNNQQQNNQQQNNQQQNQTQTQQGNSTVQNNGQQQATNQQENQSSKKTNNPFNTFTDFLTKPQEFMKDCSKNPVKMMELMLTMNMLSGNGAYPFYNQSKMSEKSYQKYLDNPNEFMEKFINDPMKFVGMMGSSSDKLQSCFQTYLDKNNGEYPEGVTMALCKVATYLNNAQQMMAYNNGAAMPNQPIMGYNNGFVMPNQPMMYGGGYGVPYGTVGNIALPSTFYATAVSQIRFEQGLLSEWKKQNKIAKKKLELKKQEIAEIKRGNDIAELKQVGKFFSNSKIKGEELNSNGKQKITYTGPDGRKIKYEVTRE